MIKTLARALTISSRPSSKASLLALLALLSVAGFNARAESADHALREKDVLRAERIVAKLRDMERARWEAAGGGKQRNPLAKLSASLFVEVAKLHPSDLKTDLTSALFLYEEADQRRLQTNGSAAAPDCANELREIYARLCRESRPGTLADFLLAKAQLHLSWAEATIKVYRGSKDTVALVTREKMLSERRSDLRLAESAIRALRSLEKDLYNYSSLIEFEEQRKLARISFEQFAADASEALRYVDRVLLSLPRSTLFNPLYHARNSYANGLFWWQKTYRQSRLVVNVNSFNEPDEIKSASFDPDAVNYTVAINWRKAIKHTRQAENIIEALKVD
jgi:hypothetical protein